MASLAFLSLKLQLEVLPTAKNRFDEKIIFFHKLSVLKCLDKNVDLYILFL